MKQTKTGQLGGHGLTVAGLILGVLGKIPTVLIVGLGSSGLPSLVWALAPDEPSKDS